MNPENNIFVKKSHWRSSKKVRVNDASGGLIKRTNARAGANDGLEFVQALRRSTVGTVYDNLRNWLICFKQLDGILRPVASGANVDLKEAVFWRRRECKWMPLEY